jgi:riboflavin kinase/FMN adenylyltransferase
VTPTEFHVDDPPPPSATAAAVAIGNFDGVHRGHHRLIAVLRAEARRLGVPAVAVCLFPHPLTLLKPELAPATLLWPERRAAILRAAGADVVVFLRTTRELLSLSAEEFFDRLLLEKLQVRALVEGENFRFGRGRAGDVRLLGELCKKAGVPMTTVSLADDDAAAVSSTRIRAAVMNGDLERAAELAGRNHRIRGVVGVGARRGRTIGFPTANLGDVLGLVPASGVYVVSVRLDDDRVFGGACNVGANPTFADDRVKIETHLLDFHGDLYGQAMEVEFLRRLRPVQSFASAGELTARIRSDVDAARAFIASTPPEPIHPESAATIAEWVRWDSEPSLSPIGVRLEAASFVEPGVLRLDWRVDGSPPAPYAFELMFGLEERLRRVFPEVKHVLPATPAR